MRIKESTLKKLISKEINLLNEEAGVPTGYQALAKFILMGVYNKQKDSTDKKEEYTLKVGKEMYSFLDIRGRLAKTAPDGFTVKAKRIDQNSPIRGYRNPTDKELFLTFVSVP